jgi:DNA-directed RNA polymerase subunit RPC12/RpoP
MSRGIQDRMKVYRCSRCDHVVAVVSESAIFEFARCGNCGLRLLPPMPGETPGPIRLACCGCDRDDFDGIAELPTDWYGIDEVQTLAEATADNGDSSWWTHLGWCVDCVSAEPHLYEDTSEQANLFE